MAGSTPRNENMIAALQRERAGYVARGDDDRVRQVDEQLRHYGYEDVQDPVTDPAGGPKGRTTAEQAQQRTADSGDGSQAAPAPAAKKAAAKKTTPSKPPTG